MIYYGVFAGVFLTIAAIIIYSHFSTMARLSQQLKDINKQRSSAQKILIKNKEILAQQEAVKDILQQEPNFYIGKYFTNDLMQQINLPITSGPDLSETDVGNGFIERKLTVTFGHINMKQLTELLLKIEQKERVYTKELKITKDIKDGLLNVTLIIATLEPQQTPA
jgi:hypothetical protein